MEGYDIGLAVSDLNNRVTQLEQLFQQLITELKEKQTGKKPKPKAEEAKEE